MYCEALGRFLRRSSSCALSLWKALWKLLGGSREALGRLLSAPLQTFSATYIKHLVAGSAGERRRLGRRDTEEAVDRIVEQKMKDVSGRP